MRADKVSTVSPTYAREIQGPEAGWGLDGLLRRRSARLTGILNGIDVDEWNPETDPDLPERYGSARLAGKAACKRALLRRFGLAPTPAPLFGLVGRLAHQKGIDLLLEALPLLLQADMRLVLLGSGDPYFEAAVRELPDLFPGQVGTLVGFDHQLSHLLEAGSDFFLMPSLYEPCGLNQMYSLRYGTPPVVRATGGLVDTVEDGPDGTGFLFDAYHPVALLGAVRRALSLYAEPARLAAMQRRGMARDFSWTASARRYAELYASLPPRR